MRPLAPAHVRVHVHVLVLVLATTTTCALDPVHDDAVADLGPEAPGVSPGPLHRPAQPCLVCHDGSVATPAMAAGGTIYGVLGETAPLAGATVTLTDAHGATSTATTNAAGNFFVDASSAPAPAFPLRVAVGFGGLTATMTTIIGRDGSCATCHAEKPSRVSAGPVYVAATRALLPPGAAP